MQVPGLWIVGDGEQLPWWRAIVIPKPFDIAIDLTLQMRE